MKRTISRLFLASCLAFSFIGCTKAEEPVVNEASSTTSNSGIPRAKHPDRLFQLEDLAVTKAKIAGKEFRLWIMDDVLKRREGMMYLPDADYAEDQGMVFVFKDVQPISDGHGFWMHNTLSALDIIYVDKNKKVINVGKGVPQTDTSVKPEKDYLYVVELKQGTAAELGLKKGDAITFEKSLVGLD